MYLFFKFSFNAVEYPSALVHWYSTVNESPDPVTGLWVVEPELLRGGRNMGVIHLDSIIHGAHLLPQFPSDAPVYWEINFTKTLDVYRSFYVNKYVDYHTFEIAF